MGSKMGGRKWEQGSWHLLQRAGLDDGTALDNPGERIYIMSDDLEADGHEACGRWYPDRPGWNAGLAGEQSKIRP